MQCRCNLRAWTRTSEGCLQLLDQTSEQAHFEFDSVHTQLTYRRTLYVMQLSVLTEIYKMH